MKKTICSNVRCRAAILAVAFSLCAQTLRADAPFTYRGRVGLFSSPEFTSSGGYQETSLQGMTSTGILRGQSERFLGEAYPPNPYVAYKFGHGAWVAEAATAVTFRVGLYDSAGGSEFTKSGGYQESSILRFTNSGWVAGQSQRFNGGSTQLGVGMWIAKASTGVTTRIGLFDADFTSSSGVQNGQIDNNNRTINEAGQVIGYSEQFNGQGSALASTAWVADATTGVTTRLGLSGPGFTSSNGLNPSSAIEINDAGQIAGSSPRASGNLTTFELGTALWLANSATGVTSRVGLYDAGGGNQFTSNTGFQNSSFTFFTGGARTLTSSGYAVGTSVRYNGGSSSLGDAAWVGGAVSGTTFRVGLYDAGGGNEYTSSTGTQNSLVTQLTEAAKVIGYSTRYSGGAAAIGRVAWVADAMSGTTTRIGLFGGAGNEFTSSTGFHFESVTKLTESGFAFGDSWRFNGGAGTSTSSPPVAGYAAWVANAGTGVTTRLGFTSSNYTSTSGYQMSVAEAITESGHLRGYSRRYSGASQAGQAAWLASASTGNATRVGLFTGTEFVSTFQGTQSSSVVGLTESGYARGHSNRYNFGSSDGGQASWIASASTGTTTRIGLTGSGFEASTGYQFSETLMMSEAGIIGGSSKRYDAALPEAQGFRGLAAWVAGPQGTTTRVGVYDATHTSDTGYQLSTLTNLVVSGYAAGYSNRFNGNSSQDGQTAWVYDILSGEHSVMLFSTRPSDGYAYSSVSLLSDAGIALGIYTLFSGESNLGNRAFAFVPGAGAFDIGTNMDLSLVAAGWDFFQSANFSNSAGLIAGSGDPFGNSGYGVYLLQAIPEPHSWALLAVGVLVACLLRPRRRA